MVVLAWVEGFLVGMVVLVDLEVVLVIRNLKDLAPLTKVKMEVKITPMVQQAAAVELQEVVVLQHAFRLDMEVLAKHLQ
jgi:acetate kinase